MATKEEGAEPMTKRQKCGDEVPSPSFGGGPMYDEATARKILKETVLITAEFTEDGEAVVGIDPSDTALDNIYEHEDDTFAGMVTPMIYFARKGDAKMCRYLISRGASTTKCPVDGLFPMSAAAGAGNVDICMLLYVNGAKNDVNTDDEDGATPMHAAAGEGHLEVCKFLHANGASNDIWKGKTDAQRTPLHDALHHGHDELVRWLVLQGALCADANSERVEEDRICPEIIWQEAKTKMNRTCERLVEWAEEVTQCHSSVVMFLLGALPPAPAMDQSRTLQCLSGHPGIRKHIGDFVGLEVTKGKHLRILRQVVDVVPSFIRSTLVELMEQRRSNRFY